jgi:phage tail sheath protein FI
MPPTLTYPGVYIEEMPSGARTISGVATSIAAFVGRTWRGPVGKPVDLFSYADYEREFGGLWRGSSVSYAVHQFFQNGGSHAVVVRVVNGSEPAGSTAAAPATITLNTGTIIAAASPGTWGRNLRATVDQTVNSADLAVFNLFLFDDPASKADAEARGGSGAREVFRNVSMAPDSPRFVTTILEQQSKLARIEALGAERPDPQSEIPAATSGSDGMLAGSAAVAGAAAANELIGTALAKSGLHALLDVDLFNLLCLPPVMFTREVSATETERLELDVPLNVWTAAAQFCLDRRALLVVDAPGTWNVEDAVANVSMFSSLARKNAALYFPRVRAIDPLRDNQLADFVPCGIAAGVMARTDATRGVWKAPAGVEANLQGVVGLSIKGQPAGLTDDENGRLNPLGINCLRNLPAIGHVAWGARTLEGSDVLASQWKYLPVRRLALFLEESLFRGTQWVVFEPNDEPLWSQIRLNLGGFMHTLFRQGAFQGATPREAYFVKCDKDTTTQTDIDNGIVNIVVGFAPLKPAEFVVIRIQQIAQQPQV